MYIAIEEDSHIEAIAAAINLFSDAPPAAVATDPELIIYYATKLE